eukprot:scaffold6088_cov33-Phaeocystis_antarctica.AAC.1
MRGALWPLATHVLALLVGGGRPAGTATEAARAGGAKRLGTVGARALGYGPAHAHGGQARWRGVAGGVAWRGVARRGVSKAVWSPRTSLSFYGATYLLTMAMLAMARLARGLLVTRHAPLAPPHAAITARAVRSQAGDRVEGTAAVVAHEPSRFVLGRRARVARLPALRARCAQRGGAVGPGALVPALLPAAVAPRAPPRACERERSHRGGRGGGGGGGEG